MVFAVYTTGDPFMASHGTNNNNIVRQKANTGVYIFTKGRGVPLLVQTTHQRLIQYLAIS